MIYRLEIENFMCFRDRQVLDLTVPQTTPANSERFAPIYHGSKTFAPKAIAVYGANASGKSTVLKALSYLAWFIKESWNKGNDALPFEAFNDDASANRPIRLAIEFGGIMDISRSAIERARQGQPEPCGVYRYELELCVQDGLAHSVALESLKQKPGKIGRWRRVFQRRAGTLLLGSKVFPLAGYAKVINRIPDHASTLAVLAFFEHEASEILLEAASEIVTNLPENNVAANSEFIFKYLASNREVVDDLNKELQRIDVGINEIQMVPIDDKHEPLFQHEGLASEMPWRLESHGTQTFIQVFPWLLYALKRGSIALIDELDIAIHPLILPEILRWFYDKERNQFDAQLWMTGHSVFLLDELLKEETVFCEKDRQGRAKVYSLMDIKSVRRSDNLYKKYMGGVYGAVPHIA